MLLSVKVSEIAIYIKSSYNYNTHRPKIGSDAYFSQMLLNYEVQRSPACAAEKEHEDRDDHNGSLGPLFVLGDIELILSRCKP